MKRKSTKRKTDPHAYERKNRKRIVKHTKSAERVGYDDDVKRQNQNANRLLRVGLSKMDYTHIKKSRKIKPTESVIFKF